MIIKTKKKLFVKEDKTCKIECVGFRLLRKEKKQKITFGIARKTSDHQNIFKKNQEKKVREEAKAV